METHRCVAVDHLGFGLSDKISDQERLTPDQHADRLLTLIDELNLTDITLVMSDWGVPIGLDIAVRRPDLISGLILFNGWAWPVRGQIHFEMLSWMMSSGIGQFWIRWFNSPLAWLMPMSVGVKPALTPEVIAHYRMPFDCPDERAAMTTLYGSVITATDWLHRLWAQRESFVGKPALVIWGGADILYRRQELRIWETELQQATIHFHAEVGHLPPDEIPELTLVQMRHFLDRLPVHRTSGGSPLSRGEAAELIPVQEVLEFTF